MKKPRWQAKAFYIIFALALILGLVPLTAMAGEATICISGPAYAKEGETITFTAETNPEADSVTWDMPAEFVATGAVDSSIIGYFATGSAGQTYVVHAVGHWGANLVQDAYFEILIGVGLIPQLEYNIIGADATFCVPDLYKGHVTGWRFEASPELGTGWSVVTGGNARDNCVTVHGSAWGELVIYADTEQFSNPVPPYQTVPATSLMAIKKWGKIYDTWLFGWDEYTQEPIWGSGDTQVYWDENSKSWIGGVLLIDLIIGLFRTDGGEQFNAFADGADVEFWVLDARAPVETLPSGVTASVLVPLIEDMQAAYPSYHVGFGNCDTKYYSTDSSMAADAGFEDLNGVAEVPLVACGEEAVKVVVVAKYPHELHYTEWPVFPEFISWNFWTQQIEKVPQVRWAGEKIVLEKQFGTSYYGDDVLFNLEAQSVGSLFPLDGSMPMGAQQVWTDVDENGVARCILESEAPGEVDVTASLYEEPGTLINQAGFVVFFLKFEDMTLGNMQGEREYHNDGMWNPVLGSGMVLYDSYPNDLYDPNANWVPDQLAGKTIRVWKGELEDDGTVTFVGDLQIRQIVSNTADTIVVDPNWTNPPKAPTGDLQWYYMIADPVWDPTTDDLSQELNVSQDTLLRARVRGWFMGDDLSVRPARYIDTDGDGVDDMMLPAGRWVLPDDWPILAGGALWQELRPHWDIMTQPNDNIMSEVDLNLDKLEELGNYIEWTLNESPLKLDIPGDLVAEFPVVGPISSLDTYTPTIDHPNKIDWKTIIPNGKLNWWDCPMPPAKIIFEITDGAGFFKDVDKGDVYYQWVNTISEYPPVADGVVYTNPYYYEWIPSSPFIPPFLVNGGYDWNSWDRAYGPYQFWTIFNQLPGMTPSTDANPTKVEVYSDNHGEAMVWLNGDWNLDLEQWRVDKNPPFDAFDIPTGTIVGDTTIMAIADYPYLRKHPPIVSNTVEKTWTWGKELKGYSEYVIGSTTEKRILIFVCDRDGFPAVGEQIVWRLEGTNGGYIESYLPDTGGQDLLGLGYSAGMSWTRMPTAEEALAFQEEFGMPCHHAVAGIIVHNSLGALCDLTIEFYEREGVIVRDALLDFNPGGSDIFWQDAGYPVELASNALNGGWNEVTWQPEFASTPFDAAEPLGDAFVVLWHFDNPTGVWTAYKAGAPAYANDLNQVVPNGIYWIQVTRPIYWNQGA
jgi:hypothetical protein